MLWHLEDDSLGIKPRDAYHSQNISRSSYAERINKCSRRKEGNKCIYSGLLGYLARRMFFLLFTLKHQDQYLNTNTRIELLLNHPTLRISNNSKAIKDLWIHLYTLSIYSFYIQPTPSLPVRFVKISKQPWHLFHDNDIIIFQ